jgi:hypothetical protein
MRKWAPCADHHPCRQGHLPLGPLCHDDQALHQRHEEVVWQVGPWEQKRGGLLAVPMSLASGTESFDAVYPILSWTRQAQSEMQSGFLVEELVTALRRPGAWVWHMMRWPSRTSMQRSRAGCSGPGWLQGGLAVQAHASATQVFCNRRVMA